LVYTWTGNQKIINNVKNSRNRVLFILYKRRIYMFIFNEMIINIKIDATDKKNHRVQGWFLNSFAKANERSRKRDEENN
jgi:hypothetical protein